MTNEILEVIRAGESSHRDPSLVFVHGANVGAWCWEEHFLSHFAARGRNCLAVSLRGHAGSPSRGLFPPGIGDYVADVRQVARSLAVPPVLIGHSMGARVVEDYLLRYPAAAAVLLAPIPASGLLSAGFRMGWRDPEMVAHLGGFNAGWLNGAPVSVLRRALFRPGTPDADVLRHVARCGPESPAALHEMSYPRLRSTAHHGRPILVIGAGADAFFDVDLVCSTGRAHGVDAEIIAGMPHAMMLDTEWASVAERIERWLKQAVRI